MHSYRSYAELKNAIASLANSQELALTMRTASDSRSAGSPGPAPMDVGAIERIPGLGQDGKDKSKGKSKGKDKGKSKGKSKSGEGGGEKPSHDSETFWDKYCTWCGLYGHRKHSCWTHKQWREQQAWQDGQEDMDVSAVEAGVGAIELGSGDEAQPVNAWAF